MPKKKYSRTKPTTTLAEPPPLPKHLRALGDKVIVYGTREGTTVVERLPSGSFTTPSSASAIDETATVFATVLERLAKR